MLRGHAGPGRLSERRGPGGGEHEHEAERPGAGRRFRLHRRGIRRPAGIRRRPRRAAAGGRAPRHGAEGRLLPLGPAGRG